MTDQAKDEAREECIHMERAVPNHETSNVFLRDVTTSDLPIFFEQQLDPDANTMAAFAPKDPADRDAFTAHWSRLLGDETITVKTILVVGHLFGYVLLGIAFARVLLVLEGNSSAA